MSNVIIIMGSESDRPHALKITGKLKELGYDVEINVASAHKQPREVLAILDNHVDDSLLVYITIAGRSNALSGFVAANCDFPVIACPPFADKVDMMVNINSTLQMPSNTPVLTVIDPGNAAIAAARILALGADSSVKKGLIVCGIVGILAHKPVAGEIYDSLIQLQHRGQDAAGIITCNDRMHFKTGQGLVRDIFQDRHMKRLEGSMGIGHTRYPTSGGKSGDDEVQPFWTSVPNGIAFAHNGNIVNYEQLRDEVVNSRKRYLNTHSDSEMLMQLFADNLQHHLGKDAVGSKTVGSKSDAEFFEAVCKAGSDLFDDVQGAVSAVTMIKDRGLIAFRDPHGIRPLVMGSRGESDYIFSSEDTMFYMLGFTRERDVQPGEIIYISSAGKLFSRRITKKTFNPCIFEYVYFARPDAMINNISVYRARLRMGQNLGRKWKRLYGDLRPDVIIPAPSTSNTMALSMARELGVNYSEGLHKNTFIGRTFIMPNQEARKQSVRYKLVPQEIEIRKKRVMIVDDSIVRGTTSKEIVQMLREFRAEEVYFVSACPPVTHPCFYGVDIPTSSELIAADQDTEEIRTYLDADLLMYQDIEDLIEAVTRKGDHHIDTPCYACLGGPYIHE